VRSEKRPPRRWPVRQGGMPAASSRCELIFHQQGKAIEDFRGPWARACEAAGVPGLIFHDLRRCYARNADRAGVSRAVIMKNGGWKTEATFLRYNIVSEQDLRAGAQRVQTYLDTLPTGNLGKS